MFYRQLQALNSIGEIDLDCKEKLKGEKFSKYNTPGIYLLISDHNFGRLNGTSNILYIGCSGIRKNQKQGMLARLRNTRSKKYKLILSYIQKTIPKIKIKVVFFECETPLQTETQLLSSYLETHLELPPLNAHLPAK